MPRAIWTGAISFGMVSIPVKLYPATQTRDVAFRQLHRDDLTRIRQLRWCPAEEREVGYDEIVKGYEYAKDQYVVMDDSDFENLPVPSKRTVTLTAFVERTDIDPVYFEKSYYLEPEQTGVKPYALLLKAIEQKGLVAVGQVAIRNKESLCVLRPHDGRIVLETLFYPDEIRSEPEVDLGDTEVTEQELQMALSLIEMLEEPFDPTKYKDDYRVALLDRITAKLEGGEIVAAEEAPAPATPVDLVAALKASIEATRSQSGDETEPAAPAATEDESDKASAKKPARKKRASRSREKAKAS